MIFFWAFEANPRFGGTIDSNSSGFAGNGSVLLEFPLRKLRLANAQVARHHLARPLQAPQGAEQENFCLEASFPGLSLLFFEDK